ncbi:hypothetical protein D918_06472 [Trichuris suis]|nr:hypothetical protein D918_06472 [Trichuris suis]
MPESEGFISIRYLDRKQIDLVAHRLASSVFDQNSHSSARFVVDWSLKDPPASSAHNVQLSVLVGNRAHPNAAVVLVAKWFHLATLLLTRHLRFAEDASRPEPKARKHVQ